MSVTVLSLSGLYWHLLQWHAQLSPTNKRNLATFFQQWGLFKRLYERLTLFDCEVFAMLFLLNEPTQFVSVHLLATLWISKTRQKGTVNCTPWHAPYITAEMGIKEVINVCEVPVSTHSTKHDSVQLRFFFFIIIYFYCAQTCENINILISTFSFVCLNLCETAYRDQQALECVRVWSM